MIELPPRHYTDGLPRIRVRSILRGRRSRRLPSAEERPATAVDLAAQARYLAEVICGQGRLMQLVTTELLGDLCGLSPGPLAVAGLVGLTLWLLGWWTHRFWVVLVATVAAGVYGLYEGSALQSQPLVAS